MKALGDYIHAKNLSFAIYTAESTETCGGYPASANHEALDATTFASWGVDYIKVVSEPSPPSSSSFSSSSHPASPGTAAVAAQKPIARLKT
jgi:hypothetical protein